MKKPIHLPQTSYLGQKLTFSDDLTFRRLMAALRLSLGVIGEFDILYKVFFSGSWCDREKVPQQVLHSI